MVIRTCWCFGDGLRGGKGKSQRCFRSGWLAEVWERLQLFQHKKFACSLTIQIDTWLYLFFKRPSPIRRLVVNVDKWAFIVHSLVWNATWAHRTFNRGRGINGRKHAVLIMESQPASRQSSKATSEPAGWSLIEWLHLSLRSLEIADNNTSKSERWRVT